MWTTRAIAACALLASACSAFTPPGTARVPLKAAAAARSAPAAKARGPTTMIWPPSWLPDNKAKDNKARRAAAKTKPKSRTTAAPALARPVSAPPSPPPAWVPPAFAPKPKAPAPAARPAAAPLAKQAEASVAVVASKRAGPLDPLLDNIKAGEPGKRGEVWVLLQAALLACIAGGDVPVAGSLVRVDVGTLMMMLGAFNVLCGALTLGTALSPWGVPAPSAREEEAGGALAETYTLQTDGLFALSRHPMYGGLLLACGGFGVLTDSFTRLALTAALALVLANKAEFEEKRLADMFGDEWEEYTQAVDKRFLPWLY